jgi:hypothetical protein
MSIIQNCKTGRFYSGFNSRAVKPEWTAIGRVSGALRMEDSEALVCVRQLMLLDASLLLKVLEA